MTGRHPLERRFPFSVTVLLLCRLELQEDHEVRRDEAADLRGIFVTGDVNHVFINNV